MDQVEMVVTVVQEVQVVLQVAVRQAHQDRVVVIKLMVLRVA